MMQVNLQIPGFSILEIIQESSKRVLAKARSDKREGSVLLKILRATIDRNVIQARLRRESDLIDKYQLEGFAKPLEILELDEYLVSVLEDFGDETLSHYAEHFPLGLSHFFDLAVSIVSAIDELHENGVNHMRLCPDNILVHRATRKVKILDLETASMLNSEVNMSLGLNTIDTEVAYIAPEQSGRMNRHVDLRSNLYSLGCIFYEVLTGHRVFSDENVADLVYAHMAKAPIPLTQHVSEIPLMLESIILKLLNKNAEDRYQSIRGLRHDIEQCQKLWESNQHIESFKLGKYDTTSSLVFSQKLYGREDAIGVLEREFVKAVKGHFSLLFISGYSGIGKTKLVNEVHKSITAENGFFLNGKVDQMEKSIPYAGLIAALSDFVNHLLTAEKSIAQNYTQRITHALKDQGKLIVDVLPELGLLLGPQPDMPSLPVAESQNRFQDVLCRFIGSLSYQEHPLTIFLDDLQWADLSSLKLIHRLSQNDGNKFLMFIGAYRDNEVGPTHPLRSVFEDLRNDLQPFSEIHLDALSQESVNDFVSDSLHRDKDDTRLLSELIAKQTGSNPFFIKLMLTRLVDDNYVHLNPKTLEWNWEIQKVIEAGITDNVVDLLTENLERLPIESQNILQYAACIGNNFDLYTLKESTGLSAQEIARDLWIPLSKNIIVPLSETYKTAESYLEVDEFENVKYKFAHDRAQQAAYNLLDEEERMKLHLKIGEQLNHALSASELDSELFDVTNHFNIGLPLIAESSIAKREFIRFLNLRTANKARLSSSFTVALNYYRQAYQLFREEDWTYYLDRIAQASLDLAECEYICGNYEEAGKMYDIIYAHTSDQKYISRLYDIQLRQYAQEGRNKETLLLGGDILKKYGVGFKVEPPLYVLAPELIKVKSTLWRKDISALVDLPKLENEDKAFAIQTLMNISATAYVYDNNTMLLLVLRMMQLSLKYGNAPESAFGYGLFGFVEGAALGNASQSRAFADLSIELIKDVDDPIIRAKVIFLRAFSTQHWFEPIPLALPELREAFNLLDQSGSYTFASYCLQALMAKRLYLGEALASYTSDLIDYLQYAYKVKEIYTQNLLGVLRTYVNTLSGSHEDEFRLYRDQDEETYIKGLEEKRLLMPVAWHYVYHMMANYHFGDLETATAYAKKARIVDDVAPTTMAQIEYHFYTVLLLTKKYNNSRLNPIISMRIRWALRKLRNWSHDCPENFEMRYLLAKAQWKAVQHDIHAAEMFQEVYQKSLLSNDIFTQGMILEHWAEFLMEKREVKNALVKLEMSVGAYNLYGADEKARTLQERFLPAHIYQQKQDPTSIDSIIDIETLLRASRVISGDIQLDKLLVNLLTMLTENAGAQRGFLVLVEDDELVIQGEYDISTKDRKVLHRMPAKNSEKISTSIVNYVWRTGENVLIDDARVKSAFMNDPHLKSREVRSILCVPVANQGTTNAIIYLENNLASNVFTEKKLNMVSMLASQAAVSLDNALLYNSLEEKVATRTQELSNEKQRVDDLLLNMFPAEVAEELKLKGEAKTRLFENATILFGDFKNFTVVAEKMTPENLVQLIDLYFSAYDKIMKKYGIEKIKTIGDAYVSAGGLPDPRKGSPKEVIQAAIAMQEFTEREKLMRESKGLHFFEIRIGIHSGPVIAGVVGHLKFAYDIWGDTVNIAARMEQNGEIRKINISEHTYDLIKDEYECTYRGKIKAKNKGEIDMYFVNY